jgi:serine/threonine-protein kinase RsbW
MAPASQAERAPLLVTAWFPGWAAEVGQARELVRGVLGAGWPALDDVLLLVSEIASNAVRHTASAGESGGFDLTVSATGDSVRIAVADRGSASVPRLRGHDGELGGLTGGRGLRIVNAVASEWGHTGDELGRVVWFRVA